MLKLEELLDAAKRRLEVVEGLAGHDVARVRAGIATALEALRSSVPLETVEPDEPKAKPAKKAG